MKRREVLAAIEHGLESGLLTPIDPDAVPKEYRAEVVVMNRLIDRENETALELRRAGDEAEATIRLLTGVVRALPVPAALVEADGTMIAATDRALPPDTRTIAVPGTDGVTLVLGAGTGGEAAGPVSKELRQDLEDLREGLDRLAAGSFLPLPIGGPDDPLREVKRAFNRAVEAVAEMIAVAPLFSRREP